MGSVYNATMARQLLFILFDDIIIGECILYSYHLNDNYMYMQLPSENHFVNNLFRYKSKYCGFQAHFCLR